MNHRNRTLAVVASLTLVGTAYGCSSSSSSGDDSNATPDGGGGTGADGGGGGGGGGGGTGDGGGGGGTGKTYAGNVTMTPSLAIGIFFKDPGSGSCVTTSGGCTLYNCPIDADAGDVPTYSAGDITVTGGKLAAPLVLHYDADGGSYGGPIGSTAFAAGDTLNVSAAGGDVASFSGATGTGPGPITLTAPVGTGTPGFQSYTIDTSTDLAVTWTGGTAGTQVSVSLSNDDDENKHLELICTFDGATGSGTLPAAMLGQLGSPTSGTIEALPLSNKTVTGSNVSVTLQLTNEGTTGTWSPP